MMSAEEGYKAAIRKERAAWDCLLDPDQPLHRSLRSFSAASAKAKEARRNFLETAPAALTSGTEAVRTQADVEYLAADLKASVQNQKAAWATFLRDFNSTGAPNAALHQAWLNAVHRVHSARVAVQQAAAH
jgi:hypothetical protein